MRNYSSLLATLILTLTAATALAETKEEKRVANATDVIDQILRIPEQSVPPSLLSRAYGVAVIPNTYKAGFIFGGRFGKGILVIRQPDNSWSNPAFVQLAGGSFGWQAGLQATDIILVFKSRKGVDGITRGKLTLGADASVAAGPVGRHTEVATDILFKSEVYSYSRSRGLFAGVALEGAGLTMDRKANAAFYGSPSITPEDIFSGNGNAAPRVANNFVQMLTAQTRRLPQQSTTPPDIQTVDGQNAPKPKVRTFGIGGPDDGELDEEELAREH